MSRQIQDHDFLVWEVYPSGGSHGFPANPHVIFHCLTQQNLRPRSVSIGTDQADAEKRVSEMSDAALLELLENAPEIT
ncbi:MAG: hypothetical protein ACREK1_02135 [Longimicrobiales bacterium]